MSNPRDPITITPDLLDSITGEHIAMMHVRTIWTRADPGEMELVLQFFQVLSARHRSLDSDEISARRDDFEAQMKLVFDGTGT